MRLAEHRYDLVLRPKSAQRHRRRSSGHRIVHGDRIARMSSPAEPRPQLSLRPAKEEDAAGMREIFAEGVQDHLIPFEDQARSRDEIRSKLPHRSRTQGAHPGGGVARVAAGMGCAGSGGCACKACRYCRGVCLRAAVVSQLWRRAAIDARHAGPGESCSGIANSSDTSSRITGTVCGCARRRAGAKWDGIMAQDPSFEHFRDVIVVEYSFPSENDPEE